MVHEANRIPKKLQRANQLENLPQTLLVVMSPNHLVHVAGDNSLVFDLKLVKLQISLSDVTQRSSGNVEHDGHRVDTHVLRFFAHSGSCLEADGHRDGLQVQVLEVPIFGGRRRNVFCNLACALCNREILVEGNRYFFAGSRYLVDVPQNSVDQPFVNLNIHLLQQHSCVLDDTGEGVTGVLEVDTDLQKRLLLDNRSGSEHDREERRLLLVV
mmetsp:Transcript_47472/g.93377  ORF Transcript_47472/g.93377 Transcript_47472/m.93377 type:complete len:213 (-) Transcript_47472:4405-5043(-)